MNNFRVISIPIFLLAVASYARFTSMAGFDFAQHGKILLAYMLSPTRMLIFFIQFIGIYYAFKELRSHKPVPIRLIIIATFLLTLVSVARFYLPIFLVSVLGDLMVIWWLRSQLNLITKNA